MQGIAKNVNIFAYGRSCTQCDHKNIRSRDNPREKFDSYENKCWTFNNP